MTDLFAVLSGLPVEHLHGVVPPACRRDVEVPPAPRREGDELVYEFPAWTPRRSARHLVASLAALGARELTFRFETAVERAGRWSPWVGGATIGGRALGPGLAAAAGLEADIDQWTVSPPAARVALRLRLHAADASALEGRPWLVALSVSDLAPPARAVAGPGTVKLEVPPISQLEAPPEIALRVCSPTSVAMVLAFHGAAVAAGELAAEVFHPGLDRYGLWPAAIQAAARHGLLGYLLRFPDWSSAAWCLAQGLPVVASIRYRAGALGGASLEETREGHLVVVRGFEDGEVLVNDPAAPSRATVARRYRLEEFCEAWLAGTGIGYVLFRPPPPF